MYGGRMSDLQKFVIKKFNRSQINLADYNPRKIYSNNKKNLKKAIEKYGLITPLILNERTMNLCGGHQRIEQLDEIECYPENDYSIEFACVDVDEAEEKSINIMLNSKNLQGEFDGSLLAKFETKSLLDCGFFKNSELKLDYGIYGAEKEKEKEQVCESVDNFVDPEDFFNMKKNMREKRKEKLENEFDFIDVSHSDYTMTLVFSGNKQKNTIKEMIGGNASKFIYFDDLKKVLNAN